MKKFFTTLFLFVVILLFFFAVKFMVYQVFDKPQGFTKDSGQTISFFEIPSANGKTYVKVFPGDKKFQEILKKGEYDLVPLRKK